MADFHLMTLLLLQGASDDSSGSFASHRIFSCALSQDQPQESTREHFSKTKRAVR